MWSLGVVLYIMVSGKVPFPGKNEQEIIKNVIKGEYHFNYESFKKVSPDCKDLIQKCLVMDFKKRITASDALKHPWIISKANIDVSKKPEGG
jgi:serine/threonine protein kinase